MEGRRVVTTIQLVSTLVLLPSPYLLRDSVKVLCFHYSDDDCSRAHRPACYFKCGSRRDETTRRRRRRRRGWRRSARAPSSLHPLSLSLSLPFAYPPSFLLSFLPSSQKRFDPTPFHKAPRPGLALRSCSISPIPSSKLLDMYVIWTLRALRPSIHPCMWWYLLPSSSALTTTTRRQQAPGQGVMTGTLRTATPQSVAAGCLAWHGILNEERPCSSPQHRHRPVCRLPAAGDRVCWERAGVAVLCCVGWAGRLVDQGDGTGWGSERERDRWLCRAATGRACEDEMLIVVCDDAGEDWWL
ncbi:hypothetical protein IWX46DRAFT_51488 [Phyllosticta citricarpa]|uniref:Uncharacterized protein n=1 Tax=Phyllosticta citricarpa TaxID=55181 RepID=A0ABR1MG02_9PEZI